MTQSNYQLRMETYTGKKQEFIPAKIFANELTKEAFETLLIIRGSCDNKDDNTFLYLPNTKDFENITQSQMKQLMKIEPELSKRLSKQENASAVICDNKINIASIANAVGITRKTIYNNDVLKDYIESAGKEYDSNYPTNGLTNIREQLNESKEIINKMVRRDLLGLKP